MDAAAEQFVITAINAEKENAIDEYGLFHNDFEAWAVLREEVQELAEEARIFAGVSDKGAESLMELAFREIRNDDKMQDKTILAIRSMAYKIACEAVQVCAVCDKWMEGQK